MSEQSNSLMQVDVAIVGAGLAGLATAVALHRVRPDAKIKVGHCRVQLGALIRPPTTQTSWLL